MRRWLPVLIFVLFVAVPLGLAEAEDPLATARQFRSRGEFERAMEILHELLEAKGEDPAVLLEMARTSLDQANEILSSTSPGLGQLALLDAIRWAERAAKAAPQDPVPHRLLGRVATKASEFDKAIAAWTHASELDKSDGESLYQLGFALSYRGSFREGIAAFCRAEAILGPDARIFLNRGISHQSLGETAPAKADFMLAIETEVAAKRNSSDPIKRSWTWLWRIHSDTSRWEDAVSCFAELAEKYPTLTAPLWYLAHARMEIADHLGAAEALGRLNGIAPKWGEGYRLRAERLTKAEQFGDAATTAWLLNDLDPGGDAPRNLLLGVVRGLIWKDGRAQAMAILMAMKKAFPRDQQVLQARGDLYFAEGSMALARADYRRVIELDQWANEALVKEQKAVTALLRKGVLPEGADARALVERNESWGGVIFDFERSEVFVRVNGNATGSRDNKEFQLRRTGAPGEMANCSVTFVPTWDASRAASLVFEVTGPAGKMLNVRFKDCYDEFTMGPGFFRLAYPEPIMLNGERQTVRLDLDRIVPVYEGRPVPVNRSRLRTLIFEIGLPLAPEDDLADEIRIDNIRFETAGEEPEVDLIEDFNNDPEELIFISDGTATPFIRLISSPEAAIVQRSDPNTYVGLQILGLEFDPGMVHAGKGSYRLTLPGVGPASAVLSFNPDRSFDFADAIVFFARGETGGERLRVTIRDALDDDLRNPAPAQAPRTMAGQTLLEGHFVLSKEWRRFRIPRAEFPDVHFDALAELRFHVGTPEGNEVGTTIYLDSITWE